MHLTILAFYLETHTQYNSYGKLKRYIFLTFKRRLQCFTKIFTLPVLSIEQTAFVFQPGGKSGGKSLASMKGTSGTIAP